MSMKEVDEQMLNIQNKNSSYFVEVSFFVGSLLAVFVDIISNYIYFISHL